jgi:hypothetical protein
MSMSVLDVEGEWRVISDHRAEERALRGVAERLSLACPWASQKHIETVLRDSYGATRDAKVQNYRLVLAERVTRVRLRREVPEGSPVVVDPGAPPITVSQTVDGVEVKGAKVPWVGVGRAGRHRRRQQRARVT